MKATADPDVWIEDEHPGYVRYRNAEGRRWEVHGTCDRRGDCLVGSVVDGRVLTRQDVDALTQRPDSQLDVPVTPEFDTCCGVGFEYTELPRG